MILFLDKLPVTWNHVRMLIQECRNNDVTARAAVEGVENEFTLSIRRKAVIVDGRVNFVAEAKLPIEVAVVTGIGKATEAIVTELNPRFTVLFESLMRTAIGSLKKAWRMVWP